MDVNEELKLLRKFTKKIGGGVGLGGVWVGGGGCSGLGSQGGCERRIEVFVKIHFFFFWGGGGGWVRGGGGGSGWGGGGG